MTEANRNAFSDALGVEPILLDCTSFSRCRRPRLYWVDWEVKPGEGELLKHCGRYHEWVFPPLEFDTEWWLDKHCRQAEDSILPTFTRALYLGRRLLEGQQVLKVPQRKLYRDGSQMITVSRSISTRQSTWWLSRMVALGCRH